MSQPTMRSRSSQFVLAVAAALILAVVIIGVPLLLAALGGDPLPRHVGSWSSLRDDLLHKDATGTLFIRLLVIVGWLAWACFALSIVVEIVARLRGRAAAHLPGLGGPQRWAAGLITAVALTITAPAAGLASPHAPVAAVAVTTPDSAPIADQAVAAPAAVHQDAALAGTHVSPETATPDEHLVYKVHKGDYLGRIAERFGGTFGSATEIAHHNHIKDPNLINIGERITLPAGAEDSGVHRHATGDIVAGSGAQSSGDSEAPSTQSAPLPQPASPAARAASAADPARPGPGDRAAPPVASASPTDTASPVESAPPVASAPPMESAPPVASGVAQGTADHVRPTAADPARGATRATGAADGSRDAEPSVAMDAPAEGVVSEMLAASGTLAAVVSLAVVVMRRRDQIGQRLGRTSVMPATGGGGLRLMSPTRVEDVVRLDTALRVLSDRVADWPVEAIPQVAGVWLDHGSATLLLADESRSAPSPFVDDPNGWRLDPSVTLGSPADQIAPLPLLCTVGGRDRQHALLDLEYLRMLGIGGDPVEAMNLLRFIVAELCHNVWADDVRVTLAGFGPEAATLSAFDPARIRVEPSIPVAVAAFHHRLADAVANLHDVRSPDVLLVAAPAISDHVALSALERDLMATPGVGMAAVVAPTPDGLPVGKYQMNVGGGGDLHIGFLGDALMPAASLPAALVGEVVSLIAEARETGDPSPLDLARAASRTVIDRVPGGRAMQFAGQRRQDPAQRSFRAELEELTRGQDVRHAGIG